MCIGDVQVIFVEGTSEKPDQAEAIKEQAIQQAIQMAQNVSRHYRKQKEVANPATSLSIKLLPRRDDRH